MKIVSNKLKSIYRKSCAINAVDHPFIIVKSIWRGMSNNWFLRHECTQRSEQLKDFYQSVMDDFFDKLFREYKHKKSNIDEQKIFEFQGRVHQNLQNNELLLESCVRMKEGSSRLDQIPEDNIHPKAQLKIEHEDKNDEYISILPKHRSSEKIEKKQQNPPEYEDDLADLQDWEQPKRSIQKIKSQVQVKKEEQILSYLPNIKSEVKIENGDDDSVEQQTFLTIQQCEKSLNCIILGTFNANTLKHRPKQQKTSINLDNVFIKHPWGEAFYGQIAMQSNKMEKDNIRKQIEKERQLTHIRKNQMIF